MAAIQRQSEALAVIRIAVASSILGVLLAGAQAQDATEARHLDNLLAQYIEGHGTEPRLLGAIAQRVEEAGGDGLLWLEDRTASLGGEIDLGLSRLRGKLREKHPAESFYFLLTHAGVPSFLDARFVRYEVPDVTAVSLLDSDGASRTTMPGEWRTEVTNSFGWNLPPSPDVFDVNISSSTTAPLPTLPPWYRAMALPKRMIDVRFEEYCDGFVTATTAGSAPAGASWHCGAPTVPLRACVLAFWARARGLGEMESRLLAIAVKENPAIVRDDLRRSLRRWMWRCDVLAANEGVLRDALLDSARRAWELEPESREASTRVAQLESLVADDAALQLASLTGFARAGRLLRDTKLRYVARSGELPSLAALREAAPHDPFLVLVDGGWEAVPSLLPLVGDDRPSRAVAFGGRSDSARNPSIGECAKIALDSILGIGWGKETKLGDAWTRLASEGPRVYYRRLLSSPIEENRALAAERLLAVDGAAAVEVVLARACADGETSGGKLVDIAAPYVDAAHRPMLEKLLGSTDLGVAVAAARATWGRFRSGKGAERMCALVQQGLANERLLWEEIECGAVDALCEMTPGVGTDIVPQLLRHESCAVRVATIDAIARHRVREFSSELVRAITDREGTGVMTGVVADMRVCDVAARGLARVLGVEPLPLDEYAVAHDAATRDRAYQELVAWWEGREGKPSPR